MIATRLWISCVSLGCLLAPRVRRGAGQESFRPGAGDHRQAADGQAEAQTGGEAPQGAGDALPQVAERGRHLHHHRRRARRLQAPPDRRRARAVHRAVLAAPRPDARTRAENEFKEEHYRRIAYANERYASGIPGWKTDRGRIYITFGPPDENRVAPLRRHLRAAHRRRRRHHLHLSRSRSGATAGSRASAPTS